MSAVDFRRIADIGDAGDYWGVVVEDPAAARPLELRIGVYGVGDVQLHLEYAEVGELFDTLAQALGIILQAQAVPGSAFATAALVGLHHAADTPDEGKPSPV